MVAYYNRKVVVKQRGYTKTYVGGKLVKETNPKGVPVIRIYTKRKSSKKGGGVSIRSHSQLSHKERLTVAKAESIKARLLLAAEKKAKSLKEAQRIQAEAISKEIQKRAVYQTLSERTARSRQNRRVLEQAALVKELKDLPPRPFTKKYKEKTRLSINEYLKYIKPSQRKIVSDSNTVKINNINVKVNTLAEKIFFKALDNTIKRDKRFKKQFNTVLIGLDLKIRKEDKILGKAVKGVGVLAVGILSSPILAWNLADKIVITNAGLLLPSTRKDVLHELGRAGKKTPRAISESLDPRQPENWANIGLIFLGGRGIGKFKHVPTKSSLSEIIISVNKKIIKINKFKIKKSKLKANVIKDLNKIKFIISKTKKSGRISKKNMNNLLLVSKRSKAKITELERFNRRVATQAKALHKTEKGLMLKARRVATITRGGKKQWVFTDFSSGNIRYFNSRNLWLKAVKSQEKLIRLGKIKDPIKVKLANKRIAYALKIDKSRIALRREAKLLRTGRKGKSIKKFTKEELKHFKLKAKREAVSHKDISKSFKFTISKSLKINNVRLVKKKIFDKVVNGKKVSTLVVSSGDQVIFTAKTVKKNFVAKAIVNKPSSSAGGVKIKTGNGQVLLLKPTKTLKTSPIVKSKQVTVVKVKKNVIKDINDYYRSLLKSAKTGVSVKVLLSRSSRFKSLHQKYFSLLSVGKVNKNILAVKSIAKVISRVKPKTVSVIKSITLAGVRSGVKVAVKVGTKPVLEEVYRELYNKLLRRAHKNPRHKLKWKKITSSDKLKINKFIVGVKPIYRPSLVSVIYGITSYKIPKRISGFDVRPIIIKRK